MNNEQILKKAIEKAEKNGWQNKYKFTDKSWHYLLEGKNYYKIIFSHDFAKAFWGEENYPITEIEYGGHKVLLDKVWKARLQQMVLEKEPLKYLEKFI